MESDATLLLSAGALIIGTLFGIVVQRSRFCMVAAVSNITLLRDFRQLHGYLAALLVALLGTTWLEQGGWVAVAESTYRSAQLDWLGAVCGGLTVAGWWVTGYWAVDEFSLATPASLTFSGPMARTMLFLISGKTSTALPFGIALVAGVLLGAALSALITRTFHWRPPQARYLHRPLIGGVLIGVGAIWAGGCNIGNGLTGMSTGSSEALLATIMILTGVYFGVRWLLHAKHVPFDDEKSSPPIPQHIAAAGDSHDKSTTQPQHKSAA